MSQVNSTKSESPVPVAKLILSWLWVGLPLCWGVSQTVIKALGLFR
jgi:hypothetical protein